MQNAPKTEQQAAEFTEEANALLFQRDRYLDSIEAGINITTGTFNTRPRLEAKAAALVIVLADILADIRDPRVRKMARKDLDRTLSQVLAHKLSAKGEH